MENWGLCKDLRVLPDGYMLSGFFCRRKAKKVKGAYLRVEICEVRANTTRTPWASDPLHSHTWGWGAVTPVAVPLPHGECGVKGQSP